MDKSVVRPAPILRGMMEGVGFGPGDHIVTHCEGGGRAALAAAAHCGPVLTMSASITSASATPPEMRVARLLGVEFSLRYQNRVTRRAGYPRLIPAHGLIPAALPELVEPVLVICQEEQPWTLLLG